MGREIRRVPAGWEHPEHERCPHRGGIERHDGRKCYVPMYDKDYETAKAEWLAELAEWQAGTHKYFDPECDYWEYSGDPPSREQYRQKWEGEPTHYQVYETVSEGTPTSPVFASLDELKGWLIGEGYSKQAADNFCRDKWVPSMVMYSAGDGTPPTVYVGIESAGAHP